MEKQIKSYVGDFEHGMSFSSLIENVSGLLWCNHMKRTATRLTQMAELPALKKIYGLIGEDFSPVCA